MSNLKELWVFWEHLRGGYDVVTESGNIEYYALDKRTAEQAMKKRRK